MFSDVTVRHATHLEPNRQCCMVRGSRRSRRPLRNPSSGSSSFVKSFWRHLSPVALSSLAALLQRENLGGWLTGCGVKSSGTTTGGTSAFGTFRAARNSTISSPKSGLEFSLNTRFCEGSEDKDCERLRKGSPSLSPAELGWAKFTRAQTSRP